MSRVHVAYHLTLSKNFDDIDAVISKLRNTDFVNIKQPLSHCLLFEKNLDTTDVGNILDHAKNILASVYDLKFVLSVVQIDGKGTRTTLH
ncbi:MAG: hypothetical protein V4677_00665 [Bacteroidota bacterium]